MIFLPAAVRRPLAAAGLAVLVASVLACTGGGGGSATPAPGKPVASAGADLAVASGVSVTLDGSGSTDPAGGSLAYAWAQVSGSPVALSSATAPRPSFVAPSVAAGQPPATLVFALVVSSAAGASAPAQVVVTVAAAPPANPAPVANAGPDVAVASAAAVTLDGTGSGDADGQPITFAWSQRSGPAVTLAAADTAHPTFTAPAVAAGAPPATLVFALVVSDADAASAAASVTVTVNPEGVTNLPPPGTPPPGPPDPNPPAPGGSGSNRWQIGAAQGLYIVDPARVSTASGVKREPTVQGLVNVTFGPVSSGNFIPPDDTVVTLNGVPLLRDPALNGSYFRVDETAAVQPVVHSGGSLVLVATSSSTGKLLERTLVLPCPSDIEVTSDPAAGAVLVPADPPATPLHLTSTSDLLLNAGLPILNILPPPAATLWGYEPATRTLVPAGSPKPFGGGPLDVRLGVPTTTAAGYLVDLRWPGHWIIDGETGGFCGLVKRWTYAR